MPGWHLNILGLPSGCRHPAEQLLRSTPFITQRRVRGKPHATARATDIDDLEHSGLLHATRQPGRRRHYPRRRRYWLLTLYAAFVRCHHSLAVWLFSVRSSAVDSIHLVVLFKFRSSAVEIFTRFRMVRISLAVK